MLSSLASLMTLNERVSAGFPAVALFKYTAVYPAALYRLSLLWLTQISCRGGETQHLELTPICHIHARLLISKYYIELRLKYFWMFQNTPPCTSVVSLFQVVIRSNYSMWVLTKCCYVSGIDEQFRTKQLVAFKCANNKGAVGGEL